MKICNKCKEDKPLSEFSPSKIARDGLKGDCKKCRCIKAKIHYVLNHEKYKENAKRWGIENPEKIKEIKARWNTKNPEKVKERHRKYKRQNPDKIRADKRIYMRRKRGTLKGKLNCNLSSAICNTLKKGSKGNRHWEELVDFTIDQLKSYLEKLFQPEMTWENYGTYWSIDHKIPIAAFNFNKPEHIDFRLCWSLKNLQPLETEKNIRKQDKIEKPFQPSLALAI